MTGAGYFRELVNRRRAHEEIVDLLKLEAGVDAMIAEIESLRAENARLQSANKDLHEFFALSQENLHNEQRRYAEARHDMRLMSLVVEAAEHLLRLLDAGGGGLSQRIVLEELRQAVKAWKGSGDGKAV